MKTCATPLKQLARATALSALLCAFGSQAAGLQDCPAAPFGDVSAEQHAALLDGRCVSDSSRWKVETPKARAEDVGPSRLRAEYSSLSSMRYSEGLQGTIKFDWSGMRGDETGGGLRTERTAVSLGGLYQIDESLALQTNVGLEHAGAARTRATISSMWRPIRSGILFAEWAGSEAGTEARRIGGRWWLVPRMIAIDLGARYVPDGPGWVDQRIGLALNFKL